MHDLDRVIELCRHFGVPPLVCINKWDVNEENSRQIEAYCGERGVALVSRIPFDNAVTEALVSGVPVVEFSSGRVSREIENLWRKVAQALGI